VLTHLLQADRRRLSRKGLRGEVGRGTDRPWRGGAVIALSIVLVSLLPLGGCVDPVADLSPSPEAHTQFVRRPDVSLAGASVAFVSVDGPPAAISANFSQMLNEQAAAHDIVIADPKKARYLVRGYLTAYATEDGAAIGYVWDVFTRDKQRTQRVDDVLNVKGEGSDPWRIAGQAALESVAAKSADDLAAFLSNTPEAVASAAATGRPSVSPEGKPLSYAPIE
jgi:hypothetical protein